MGGRLDSTNVINPMLSVITNISREHTQHLGETLPEIAAEKAGIIKPRVPVVTAVSEPEALSVIEARARKSRSRLHKVQGIVSVDIHDSGLLGSEISISTSDNKYNNIKIKLAGRHQHLNAATSVLAAELLSGQLALKPENIGRGLESTRWQGRLQVVRRNPTVIVDSTHNPGGARTLAAFLSERFQRDKPVLVLGMLEDKEVGPVVKLLEPLASRSLVTQSSYHRRMKAKDLASFFRGRVETFDTVPAAVERALELSGNAGTVLITGSILLPLTV